MYRKISTKFIVLIFTIILSSCNNKSNTDQNKNKLVDPNFISNFEKELSELKSDEITTLDKATNIFKNYISKTNSTLQKDSLFMPYFSHYNLGRQLLKNQPEDTIMKYGFKKIHKGEQTYLVPIQSDYLESNVITHLSQPMKKFCRQQLKEFSDPEDLETIAQNTLWWEKFNKENPTFFLKDMSNYHYKNWHLKNLISGTGSVAVFTEEDKLTKEAKAIYLQIKENHPKSITAKTIKVYLVLLEKNNMTKTEDVKSFIDSYK